MRDKFLKALRSIKPKSLVAFLCMCIAIPLIIGMTYTWFFASGGAFSAGNAAGLGRRSMSARYLQFELDTECYGVPGEELAVTTANRLLPDKLKNGYIFAVTYTIPAESKAMVQSLQLQPEIVERMALVRQDNPTQGDAFSVTYYGKGQGVTDLGPLLIHFSSAQMDAPVQVDVHAGFCQIETQAFQEVFQISDQQLARFSHLLAEEESANE